MFTFKRLALLLALLIPFVTGSALADTAPIPEPDSPKTAILEDGKVIVHVGTKRDADYAVGASIPIIVVFELQHSQVPAGQAAQPFDPRSFLADTPKAPTAPAAKPLAVPRINYEGLNMGVLSSQPEDTVLLVPPVAQMYHDGDKDYLRIIFWVWQFTTGQKNGDGTPKRQVSVTADFLYAVDTLPDGQPDWKKASTPEILIDTVPSAGAEQAKMREGDLDAKASLHAPIIPYLIGVGVCLMVPLFLGIIWLTYCAYVRPRRLSANEVFWMEVDKVVAQAEAAGGFMLEDYQKIIYELRRRYDVATLHVADVLKALEAEPNFPKIAGVFALEDVFFQKDGTVTSEQHEELMASLKLLIPRT